MSHSVSNAELILTLDVGTSSVRAILYDAQATGLPHTEVQIKHQVHATADGGVELDPATLLANTARAIDGVLAQVPRAASVAAVAADTLWHSVLGVDRDEQAISPLYTWADTRAAGTAAALRARLDAQAVYARTGCVLHPSYLPAKLAWLSQTHGDVWRRATRWLSFGEYFYLRLFGRTACSLSMASGTGLLDVHRCAWDEEILEAVGLDAGRLAPLVDLGRDTALYGLQGDWKARWPALAAVPWFPAVGDGASGNVGSGCTTPERIALTVGTSGAMRVVLDKPDMAVVPGLWFYRVDRQRPLLGGALSEGGNIFAWMRDTLQFDALTRLDAEIAAEEPDGHGLTMLPFLAGERSPDWAAQARGAIDGLTLATRPIDIMRAALEAIAYRFALILRRLESVAAPTAPVIASGGGLLVSPAWMQIMADVLDRRVVALTEHEASSRGTALLALEALDRIDPTQVAADLGDAYEPNPDHHARYQEAMARQVHLYNLLVGPSTT